MKFEVFATGDETVGDGTHEATIDIPYMMHMVQDEEYVNFVVSELESVFSKIFDSRARVVKVAVE